MPSGVKKSSQMPAGNYNDAVDLLGTSDEITEQLYASAGFQEIDEVAFARPFSFEPEDYVQIRTDIAGELGPALGWNPA